MKIIKGDKVKVLAGKDKGKTGKVLQIFPEKQRVSVEGINILIKHLRPRKQGEQGQRIEFPAPLNISNLMLVCPKCSKPARVTYKYIELEKDGKKSKRKIRYCKKCDQALN